jgi:hypothetical protein
MPRRFVLFHSTGGWSSWAVNHGEFILLVPSGRTVFAAQPDDVVNIIDLLLVTDLEPRPTTDGSGRRRRT